ncbi:MAG: DUF1269 domain-containing protein [Gammaproteobacteria bacterium]
MRRIYFLIPDIGTTHKIVDELRSEGIEERNIHILAKRDTPLEDLPESGVTIKTDFIPAVERGAALGGTVGLLAGLVALRFAGFTIAGGPLLGVIIAGATVGSLMGGLSGLGAGNTRLKQFEKAIDNGDLLMLLDIPKDRIDEISGSVTKHHPEAKFEGIEPIVPPPY